MMSLLLSQLIAGVCSHSRVIFSSKFRWKAARIIFDRQLSDTSKSCTSGKPMRVLYFGSDDFAIPTLKMLHLKR